jgi:hypothetical protein
MIKIYDGNPNRLINIERKDQQYDTDDSNKSSITGHMLIIIINRIKINRLDCY